MLVIIKSNFHTFSATFSQKVKAIRKEKHCDLSVTEQLMINELYCGTDSEVSVGVGGGSSYMESGRSTSGKTRALIFLWIDANWQWNVFLTSLSPSTTPCNASVMNCQLRK